LQTGKQDEAGFDSVFECSISILEVIPESCTKFMELRISDEATCTFNN
jgi:hypothetical protein